ncbi:MAG: translation initiation factor IF-2 [Planctomycetes bacterium]|nr:translation initiation factor IF-2 [Planctomycetota bacterium]MBI3847330.1 translation initiation factor IF-2 [Planctomycetota bacterium]
MKTRLYQLAKELKFEARDLVQLAREKGLDVKSNLSLLDEETVVAIRRVVSEAQGPPPAAKPEGKPAALPRESAAPRTAATAVRETPTAMPAREKTASAPGSGTPPVRTAASVRTAPAAPGATRPPIGPRPGIVSAPPLPPAVDKTPLKAKPAKPIKKEKSKKEAELEEMQELAIEELEEQLDETLETDETVTVDEEAAPAAPVAPVQVVAPKRPPLPARLPPKMPPRPPYQRPMGRPRRGGRSRDHRRSQQTTQVPRPTKIKVTLPITVRGLSQAMGLSAGLLLKKLMEIGIAATINHHLDEERVLLLGMQFETEIEIRKEKDTAADLAKDAKVPEKPENLKPRAPVVAFLGHVDHGKTSLLDAIRKTKVAAGESGGITQHIGAYRVPTKEGKFVTFLDTPGHEAFTEMRARGANVTDVVVLVVAADDGVMPQTEEAIAHAKAAKVPIVVALNKIDKREANAIRARQQLASLDLAPEEWGGKTAFIETSATTNKGLDELLERLALETEILDLKANPDRPARGSVIEAKMTEGKGNAVTLLVQDGTLKRGDVVLCGQGWGRIRTIHDDKGNVVESAGPSSPAEVMGLSLLPEAGDPFYVVESLQVAKDAAAKRQREMRDAALAERRHITLDSIFSRIAQGKVKEVRVVLKVDVKGSAEVLKKSLEDLVHADVKVRLLHMGVGSITESDILLAHASDAVVLGFHVIAEEKARALAEDKGVEIRLYQVIYEVIDDLKKAMEGMLEPEEKEAILGHVEIRQVFKVSKVGNIAGCFVKDGRIDRSSKIRLVRNGRVIHTGALESLKRFKDDARTVAEGYECGIKLANYDDIQQGDVLEAFEIQRIARKLGS